MVHRAHRASRDWHSQSSRNLRSKRIVDLGKQAHHPFANLFAFDFAQLEAKSVDQMVLLRWRLASKEQRGLAEVIHKAGAAVPHLERVDPFRNSQSRLSLGAPGK